MDTHVGRVVADSGVGGGVALVETVAGEGQHLFPQCIGLLLREAGTAGRRPHAAGCEDALHRRHLVASEVAHAAPQMIGLCPTQSGNLGRDAQNLLLKNQHTLGAAKDRFQRRVQVGHRGLAAITQHELARHAAQRRTGLEKRIGHRQVFDGARPQLAQRALRARRVALEHADGVAPFQRCCRGRVVRGDVFEAEVGVQMAAHQLCRVGQHRQRADAQQVDLGQPDGLHVAVIILRDQKALGGPLHRRDVGQRAGCDDHCAGVHAEVVGLTHQRARIQKHLAFDRIAQRGSHVCQGRCRAAFWIGVPAAGC